jgi:hypothetical protein
MRVWRTLWFGILLNCAALPAPALAADPGPVQVRSSHGGTTTWHLNQSVLGSLGIHVGKVTQDLPLPASTKRGSYRNLEFAALDVSVLRFRESSGLPRALSGGGLQHAGGFVLDFPGGSADLRGFRLKPDSHAPFALDIVDSDGITWFTLDRGHYQLEDANHTFALRYMNLHLAAHFAQMLKRPEFSGMGVGGMDTLSPVAVDEVADVGAGVCTATWPGDNGAVADIHMTYQSDDAETGDPDAIHFMRCGLPDGSGGYGDAACTQTSTDRGVVFAPDTSLVNAGTATVAWHQMFTGPFLPYNNDQHPFLIWNLYRVNQDGALQQIAASGAKHAFNTINKTCNCSDHKNSYPTCEDSYSYFSNDIASTTTPNYLGPRSEIVPATGQWGRCLSVFDKNCDAVQDADAGAQNDFQYRLLVTESDITAALQPGAAYYFEYWYVVRDQANIYDAMGYRPISFAKVPGSGGAYVWQAQVTAGNFVNGPVVNRWVDPVTPAAGSLNSELATPEGHARIAVKTTALGGGIYHYDYVVMNLDFARAVIDPAHPTEPDMHVLSDDGFSAFALPVGAGATISDVTFSDLDADTGNDWTFSQSAGALRWQAPSGHPLNWGTLYRFSFTADRGPLAATANLDVATAGSPTGYAADTLAPLHDDIFSDGFDGP